MTPQMISICDTIQHLNIAALLLTAISLVGLWFDKQKFSIVCLALALAMQSIVLFEPSCASILDLRNTPVIGGPARPAR